MARPLLIGVGTPYAGDDAAGRMLAQRLAGASGIDIRESAGIAADLIAAFEGRDRVLIVDACRSGAEPGTLHEIDAVSGDLPRFLAGVSSHGMGVAEAVVLARVLNQLPRVCMIWAIEGRSYALGDPVSPEVAATVERCVHAAPDRLQRQTRTVSPP